MRERMETGQRVAIPTVDAALAFGRIVAAAMQPQRKGSTVRVALRLAITGIPRRVQSFDRAAMKEQLLSRVFTSLLEARFPPHQRSGYKTPWIGASPWTILNSKNHTILSFFFFNFFF